MTRIRYKREGERLVSGKILTDSGDVIVTIINNSFAITSVASGSVLFSHQFEGSLPAMQKFIKAHLGSMGAIFDGEVRVKSSDEGATELGAVPGAVRLE